MSVFIFYFASDFPSSDLFFKLKKIDRISLSRAPRTYVALAADFDTPASIANYGILAPLTSFIWNRVFNVTPIVMLSTKVSGRLTTATEAAFARLIRQAGGKIHCISKGIGKSEDISGASLNPDLVGATLMTALQVSRVASIALSYVNDDDVIFTSDADIWPMSTKFWNDYISRSLNNDGDEFYVYDKRFFYEQRMKKDCNFLAVTIGFGTKTRIWRKILTDWLDSIKFAPTPRETFCVYSVNDSTPILPWYTRKDQNKDLRKKERLYEMKKMFPDLLRLFLEEGRNLYGATWEKEIWESKDNYKEKLIWSYDQVLVAELILSSSSNLKVNDDLRRLDKFGTRDSEPIYMETVRSKSVEDFTDTHLDGVEDKNWWRLEAIWLLVFQGFKQSSLFLESLDFFQRVRSFYDAIRANIDESTRKNLLFQEEPFSQDYVDLCDAI
jgi:hypothetical protein